MWRSSWQSSPFVHRGETGVSMSRVKQFFLARPALAGTILLCAVMSFALVFIFLLDKKYATDFSVYWRTANGPAEEAYFAPAGEFPFPYAPTMLLWITPLALISKWPAFMLWMALSAGALASACRPYLTKLAIALVILSPPVVHGLFTGQVSAVLAALMIWACATQRRLLAGVVFGVIASIKPQLVIMAPLLLVIIGDWRAFITAGVTFLAIIGLSLQLYGFDRWPEWIASMNHFHSVLVEEKVLGATITPASVAHYWDFPAWPFLLAGAGIGAWLVYVCRNRPPLELAAALATGSLLASPYGLTYDLAVAVPFLVWSVLRDRICSFVALLGFAHPLPLALTAVELSRDIPFKARRPMWALRSFHGAVRWRQTSDLGDSKL